MSLFKFLFFFPNIINGIDIKRFNQFSDKSTNDIKKKDINELINEQSINDIQRSSLTSSTTTKSNLGLNELVLPTFIHNSTTIYCKFIVKNNLNLTKQIYLIHFLIKLHQCSQ